MGPTSDPPPIDSFIFEEFLILNICIHACTFVCWVVVFDDVRMSHFYIVDSKFSN